jgi:hypothetical protein
MIGFIGTSWQLQSHTDVYLTNLSRTSELIWMNLYEEFRTDLSLPRMSLSFMLRPTVSRPVCLGIKQLSGAHDQFFFITVRQLWVCWCGALFLTGGRVCRLQLLLVLYSAVMTIFYCVIFQTPLFVTPRTHESTPFYNCHAARTELTMSKS